MSKTLKGARVLLLACLPALLLAWGASTANANPTHFCVGNSITPQYGCADGGTHTGNNYIEVTVNHTGCAAFNSGHGGAYYVPGTSTWAIACTAGSGTNGGYTNGANPIHGTMWNQNGSTYVYIYDAHISW